MHGGSKCIISLSAHFSILQKHKIKRTIKRWRFHQIRIAYYFSWWSKHLDDINSIYVPQLTLMVVLSSSTLDRYLLHQKTTVLFLRETYVNFNGSIDSFYLVSSVINQFHLLVIFSFLIRCFSFGFDDDALQSDTEGHIETTSFWPSLDGLSH